MSGGPASKAWVVAASVAAMEAMKDQGLISCWSRAVRFVQHYMKSNLSSFTPAKTPFRCLSLATITAAGGARESVTADEESLKKAMYLNCWTCN